jgi:hypothetical protein
MKNTTGDIRDKVTDIINSLRIMPSAFAIKKGALTIDQVYERAVQKIVALIEGELSKKYSELDSNGDNLTETIKKEQSTDKPEIKICDCYCHTKAGGSFMSCGKCYFEHCKPLEEKVDYTKEAKEFDKAFDKWNKEVGFEEWCVCIGSMAQYRKNGKDYCRDCNKLISTGTRKYKKENGEYKFEEKCTCYCHTNKRGGRMSCEHCRIQEVEKQFGDHDTHFACKEQLMKYGDKTLCCCCTGHKCKEPEQPEYTAEEEKWIEARWKDFPATTYSVLTGYDKGTIINHFAKKMSQVREEEEREHQIMIDILLVEKKRAVKEAKQAVNNKLHKQGYDDCKRAILNDLRQIVEKNHDDNDTYDYDGIAEDIIKYIKKYKVL